MKAIILAAGEGKRLSPLTLKIPKVLVNVDGKSILEHNLDVLDGIANEAIIIVGYLKEQVINRIGMQYKNLKISYAIQKELLGTGHAIMQAATLLKPGEEFIIMPGDDLFCEEDIRRCLKHKYCILAAEAENPEQYGVIEEKNGLVTRIEEKPEKPKSNLVSTGLWKMDTKIIELMQRQEKTKRNEYEITSALSELIKTEKVHCEKVKGYWIPINDLEQLENARSLIKSQPV